MENFRRWYLKNQNEITWFLIGFLVMAACIDFGRGNYVGVLINLGIAYVNYYFNNKK